MATPTNQAVFALGGVNSTIVPLAGTEFQLTTVLVPGNWTSANLVPLGSLDGINFYPLWSSVGSSYIAWGSSGPAAPNSLIAMRFDDWFGVPYVKFQSGGTNNAAGSSGATGQSASCALTLEFRAFQ
jgi:hypothetical protein